MLKLRPTYEEILREARTRRLRILPERERRTASGMLLEDVEFDDFDLSKYDKKIMITNENPQKGTQTDLFSDHSSYSSTSESLKTAIEPDKEEQQVESEHSIQTSKPSSKSEEQEQEQPKSLMRRLFDSLFEEVEVEMPISRQTSTDSGARGSNEPMPTKKDETPRQSSSSSSSSNSRSALLPVESAPISVNSSRSPTIEYVDEEDLPVNGSSSSSNRTVQYVSSRSSRSSRPITVSSGSR